MSSFIKQLKDMDYDVYGDCAPQRHNKLKHLSDYGICAKNEYFHNDRICTYFGMEGRFVIGINKKQRKIMNAYESDVWKREI